MLWRTRQGTSENSDQKQTAQVTFPSAFVRTCHQSVITVCCLDNQSINYLDSELVYAIISGWQNCVVLSTSPCTGQAVQRSSNYLAGDVDLMEVLDVNLYLPSGTQGTYKSAPEDSIHARGAAQSSQLQGCCTAQGDRESGPDLSVGSVVVKKFEEPGCVGGVGGAALLSFERSCIN